MGVREEHDGARRRGENWGVAYIVEAKSLEG